MECRTGRGIEDFNERWLRLTGLTQEQALIDGWMRVLHEEDLPQVVPAWADSICTGRPYEMEYRMRVADGSYRWMRSRAFPRRDLDGRIIRWYGTTEDIHELKETELALRRNECELSDFFENAAVGLHWVGPDGCILRVNQAELDLFGYTRDEYVGHHIAEFHADHTAIQDILARLTRGETLRNYESKMKCKDGSIRDVVISSNVLWEDGQFIHTRCFTRDITERKQAERTEAHLAAIVTHSDDAIISKDLQGNVTSWNRGAERLFGYRAEDIIGRPVSLLIPWDRRDEESHILERIRRGESIDHYETIRRRKDGTDVAISLTVSPLVDAHGKVIGASKIARDISERKHHELVLQRQSRRNEVLSEVLAQLLDGGKPEEIIRELFPRVAGQMDLDVYLHYVADDDRGHLTLRSSSGIPEEDLPQLAQLAFGQALGGTSAARFEPVIAFDIQQSSDPLATLFRTFGVQAYVCYPLMVGARLFGTLSFASRSRSRFNEPEVDLLRTLCHFVSIAMERVRQERALKEREGLLQKWTRELEARVQDRTSELRQSQDRLRALASEITLAEQRERKRLATDLHDYLAQLLIVLRLKVHQLAPLVSHGKAADLLHDADRVLTQSLDYTRSLVAELTPPTLREFGLLHAMEWLVSQMRDHGLTVLLKSNAGSLSLPEDQAVLLFQSVRELLYNVLKHAGAHQATVSFVVTSTKELELIVEDDGCGFDPVSVEESTVSRFGLFSIRERMAAMGGRLAIESAEGRGTRVRLNVPYWLMGEGTEEHMRSVTHTVQTTPLSKGSEDRDSIIKTQTSNSSGVVAHESLPIRVLLVDDHAMVRQGLRNVLEQYDDVAVIAEAANGEEAVISVTRWQPSIVVMDINMPKMNGIDATAEITSRYPDISVIGLSVNAGDANQKAMKNAGAARLLTKEAAVEELYLTIQQVMASNRRSGLRAE